MIGLSHLAAAALMAGNHQRICEGAQRSAGRGVEAVAKGAAIEAAEAQANPPAKAPPTREELRAAALARHQAIRAAEARGDWREARRLAGRPVTAADDAALSAARSKRIRKAAARLRGQVAGDLDSVIAACAQRVGDEPKGWHLDLFVAAWPEWRGELRSWVGTLPNWKGEV